jgi:hypothetical protein
MKTILIKLILSHTKKVTEQFKSFLNNMNDTQLTHFYDTMQKENLFNNSISLT